MRPTIGALTRVLVASAMALIGSCASTTREGAHPHDASAIQHEAMARTEQAEAEIHARRYGSSARTAEPSCADLLGSSGCWSSSSSSAEEHRERVEEHRKRAAEHRAASRALRDAETRACTWVSPHDRDRSPFDHREDIASVSPLMVDEPDPDGDDIGVVEGERLAGAVVTFRALPGMTEQWLRRIVECHLARNAALGHDVPEMPYCPLVPRNVTAHVSSTASGFAVELQSGDAETAREVLRRAQALVAH